GFRRFSAAAADRLVAFDWPGNVRQLGNVIRRIVVLNDAVEVGEDMLPATITAAAAHAYTGDMAVVGAISFAPLWQEERRIIEAALAAHGGNISRAAAALEIRPSTIYRKRQSWEERSRLAL